MAMALDADESVTGDVTTNTSIIDKSKFGTGYLTEAERTNSIVYVGDREGGNILQFDDEPGIGGAVPVRGYDGRWPVFGTLADSWEAHHLASLTGEEAGPSEIQTTTSSHGPRMICRSTGKCSACPYNELKRPYCQPYGNRAPVECRPVTMLEAQEKPMLGSVDSLEEGGDPTGPINKLKSNRIKRNITSDGEDMDWRIWTRQEPVISSTVYKGYQTCGRDIVKEAWDYSQFIGCNLLLALAGLFLLVRRQRLLAGQHQAMLARRIGRV